ncbi:hypothetical protein ACWCW7_34585 [Nocardia tengchongensis]
MLYKLIRSLALVAAALAAFLMTTTGQAGGAAELTDKACGLEWQPRPASRPVADGPVIYVEVLVECDAPPARHELTVLLQRRDADGNWATQATKVSKDIPNPHVSLRVSAECRAGVWRGMAHAEGSLQSNDFTFTDFSQIATLSAQDCK